jgi:stearoyl-CoA desaturase (delta-9 desaturase)
VDAIHAATTFEDQDSKWNWLTIIAFSIFHGAALAAFFFFDWRSVAVAALLYWICIGWGIGMGYHRLHTHRSYKVPKWIEYFLAVCGSMTLEGGPISWVVIHRIHHAKSDKEGDPHSPRDGAWWAHIGWMLVGDPLHNDTQRMGRMAPDLYSQPFYRWLNTWHWLPLTISGFVLIALGFALGGGAWLATSMVLWGLFLRVVLGLHSTWLVNSATHLWGSKRFATTDDSRNNWWVALLTFGEGWHNNHHAHAASARHGLAWYEVDITWYCIWTLKALGIAKNVKLAKVNSRLLPEKAERQAA